MLSYHQEIKYRVHKILREPDEPVSITTSAPLLYMIKWLLAKLTVAQMFRKFFRVHINRKLVVIISLFPYDAF